MRRTRSSLCTQYKQTLNLSIKFRFSCVPNSKGKVEVVAPEIRKLLPTQINLLYIFQINYLPYNSHTTCSVFFFIISMLLYFYLFLLLSTHRRSRDHDVLTERQEFC